MSKKSKQEIATSSGASGNRTEPSDKSSTSPEKYSNSFFPTMIGSNPDIPVEFESAQEVSNQLAIEQQIFHNSSQLIPTAIYISPNGSIEFPSSIPTPTLDPSLLNSFHISLLLQQIQASRSLSDSIVYSTFYPHSVPLLNLLRNQQDSQQDNADALRLLSAQTPPIRSDTNIPDTLQEANHPSLTGSSLNHFTVTEDDAIENHERQGSYQGPGLERSKNVPTSSSGFKKIPKPKRPLTAYNLFFQEQRKQLLKDRNLGMLSNAACCTGFEELARTISARWKEIDPDSLLRFKTMAEAEKKRYKREMEVYNEKKYQALAATQQALERTVPENTLKRYMAGEDKLSRRKSSGSK